MSVASAASAQHGSSMQVLLEKAEHRRYLVNVTRCCPWHNALISNGAVALLINASSPLSLPEIDDWPTLADICPQIARNWLRPRFSMTAGGLVGP